MKGLTLFMRVPILVWKRFSRKGYSVSYVNLDGKCFSPVQNSKGGRVKSDTIFMFRQTAENFCATYFGGGVSDGHLIGRMTGPETAELIYHSRASNGNLEAGQARVKFINNENNAIDMAMDDGHTRQWYVIL